MIGHQAECMDAVTVSLNAFLEQQVKPRPVCLGIKNILTAITSQNNVIESARIMDAGFTGHNGQLA